MEKIINPHIAEFMPLETAMFLRYALVKYGGGIVQMSGSIAGDTFARNRYGNYSRARTTPVNPNSTRQIKMRAILGTLTTRWSQTLTQANRDAWDLYGDSVAMTNRLGETINLTGFNQFIRSNSVIGDMAATYVNAGPTTFELPAKDGSLSATASQATQQFSVTFDDTAAWAGEDDSYMYFLFGSPQNPQRTFFNGPWRGFRFLSGNTAVPLTSPQVLGAIFTITDGQRAWLAARIVRADGRISGRFFCNTTIAA